MLTTLLERGERKRSTTRPKERTPHYLLGERKRGQQHCRVTSDKMISKEDTGNMTMETRAIKTGMRERKEEKQSGVDEGSGN